LLTHGCPIEAGLRGVHLQQENELFAGSLRERQVTATIYTPIESCRHAQFGPHTALVDVLARMNSRPSSRIQEPLPSSWRLGLGVATAG